MPTFPEDIAKATMIRTSRCSSASTPKSPTPPRRSSIRLSKTVCAGWCCSKRRWRAPGSEPGSRFDNSSTEKYDCGVKFRHYRTIDSLKDDVLNDQGQVRIAPPGPQTKTSPSPSTYRPTHSSVRGLTPSNAAALVDAAAQTQLKGPPAQPYHPGREK